MKTSKRYEVLATARPYTYNYNLASSGSTYQLYRGFQRIRDFSPQCLHARDYVDALNEAWLAGYAKACADTAEEEE